MLNLLGALLRFGAAAIFTSGRLERSASRMVESILFGAIVLLFSAVGLGFLYLALFRFMADRWGDVIAAATLGGANLAIALAVVMVRRAALRRRRAARGGDSRESIEAVLSGLLGGDGKLREAAPELALAALALGLLLSGKRPEHPKSPAVDTR